MRAAERKVAVGAIFVFIASSAAYSQSAGGAYTLTLDRAKPIALSSLAFGEQTVNAFGAVSDDPSEITVTAQPGSTALATVMRACTAGSRLGRAVATYTNGLGHVEYTIELKKVSVVSVVLPGATVAAKTQSEVTWTLSAAEERLNYQLMKNGGGLSDANKERLERAHDRMQALVWQHVKNNPWRAQATPIAPTSDAAFDLELEGIGTRGVLAIGPLTVVAEPKKGGDGVVRAPLSLTVDANLAGDFTAVAERGGHVPSGSVTYHRIGADGAPFVVSIVLKAITVKSEPVSQSAGSAKTLTASVAYSGLEVTVS